MKALYLFSSNIRPQYEQDIVDVAAAPRRGLFRFRYERRYVDDHLRQAWRDDKLRERPALVLYSIQQPANYHPPAFLPIRQATVVRTRQDGSVFVIDFRIGDYAVLRAPVTQAEAPGHVVAAFSTAVRAALTGHPGADTTERRFSAVEGDVPDGFLTFGGLAEQFERLTGYLGHTVSFAAHVFWRVEGLWEVGNAVQTAIEDGRWRLDTNKTYELIIVQYQPDLDGRPVSIPAAKFVLQSDPSFLEVIGDKEFEIASRYDSIPIRLRVPGLTDVRETVLAIRPADGTRGPRADLRAVVGPTTTKRFTGGAVAGAAVVLATIPGIWSKASVGTKIWFPILAALLTFALGWWALPVRRS